jgi:hypothetical protein
VNLLQRARSVLALGAINGIALVYMAMVSAAFIGEWVLNGSVSVWYGALCGATVLVGALVLMAPMALLAAQLLPSAMTATARRAAYVLVLLPLVILAFSLASLMDTLVPSIVLGFPLFVVGAFAIPYSALKLHKSLIPHILASNVARIVCSQCGALLAMARDDQVVRCQFCKRPNLNPFMSPSGTLGEPRPRPRPPPTS